MSESYPKVKFFFRWYDFWVGFYYKRDQRWLYFLPVPMFGVVFDFGPRPQPKKYFCIACKDLGKIRSEIHDPEHAPVGGVAVVYETCKVCDGTSWEKALKRDHPLYVRASKKSMHMPSIGYAIPKETFFHSAGHEEVTFLKDQAYALLEGPKDSGSMEAKGDGKNFIEPIETVLVIHSVTTGVRAVPANLMELHTGV